MSIGILIKDGGGSGREAIVTEDRSLSVTNRGVPPSDAASDLRIFRQNFTTDGLVADGSNDDMQVTGTLAAPIDFYIPTTPDADRYIDSISFLIADNGATLNKFGAITALTNGCQLFIEDQKLGTVMIHNSLKSNFDFVRLCQGEPSFGSGADAHRGSNVTGSPAAEAYYPKLDFSDIFGVPWGLRLPKDGTQRLVLRVRDTTTGVDAFDCIAYGYDRIIE